MTKEMINKVLAFDEVNENIYFVFCQGRTRALVPNSAIKLLVHFVLGLPAANFSGCCNQGCGAVVF